MTPTTWMVANTNPTGPGSLFAAVSNANADTSPALIQFDPTFFSSPRAITLPATLTLNNTSHAITIQGPTNVTVTISGNNLLTDVVVNSGVTAALQNLTLTQGNAGSGVGGGVDMVGGTLTINNCTISNNTASSGGGIYVGGGNLILQNSLITSNSNPTTASSGNGGGVAVGGGTATVLGCLFTQNASHVNFGGGDGGAIYAGGTSMTVINSTFTGNAANTGEYSYSGGAIAAFSPTTIVNSTIFGNSAPNGGGGGLYENQTTLNLVNDIVWNNTGSPSTDFAGTNGSYSASYSLLGSTSGANGLTYGPGDILNVPTASSILGTMANNGGPTQTLAPVVNSLPVSAAGNATQLSSAISASVAALAVSSSGVFSAGVLPTLASGSYYTIQIGSEQMEVVGVTASGQLSVLRGANGTTAAAHAANAPIYLVSDGRGLLAPFSTSPSVDDGAVNSGAVGGTGLSFYTQPPTTTINAGFSVAVLDVSGGTPVAGAVIGLSISSGTLNGSLTATTNASGVAVFSNLSVASSAVYTLTASAGTLDATSNSFTIGSSTVPTVSATSIGSGSVSGGAPVIINGANFTGATAVHFGTTAASSFTVNSPNQITAVAPAHAVGLVDITVTSPHGASSNTASDAFTYLNSVTLVVTNTNASGPGSLYNAVRDANVAVVPATITFDPSVFSVAQTLTLPTSLVLCNATQAVTINGPTAATLTISGNSQNGDLIQDVIALTGTCTVQNLTLTQGNAGSYGGGVANIGGGGVALLGGTLTINNCTISNNTASNGGGIYVGAGDLVLENSLITNNSNPSTASGNGGGLAVEGGTATVLGCLFTQNASHVNFGGGDGGAIYAGGTSMTVINSSFTGNAANTGEYSYSGGAIAAFSPTTIVNSTIFGNSAPNGGGGGLYENQTTLNLVNDIVWNNSGSPTPDFAGTNGSYAASYSLLGSTGGANGLAIGSGDILNVPTTSSILGSLANNGGPTQTLAPVANSLPVGAAGNVAQLSFAISTSATALTVSSSDVFASGVLPTLASGSYFTIQIGTEQMAVTGVNSSTLSVHRGINGTTAATHASGASVYIVSDQRGYVVPANSPAVVDMGAFQSTGVNSRPTITAVTPNSGSPGGGMTVTLTGTHFNDVTGVSFGSTAATSFTVNSATQITVTAPAGSGTVDVAVNTIAGTSAPTAGDHFAYVVPPTVTAVDPDFGTAAGGASVIIIGTDFTAATAVQFGSSLASTFTVDSPTQITAIAPISTVVGIVDVTVITPGGVSAVSRNDLFTYVIAATTTTLTDNGPSPSAIGQAVSFIATVGGGPDINGETVFIEDANLDNAVVASPTLTAGTVTFSIADLGGGMHHLFAVYDGDATHTASNDSATPVNQVVTGLLPAVLSVIVNGGAPAYLDSNGLAVSLAGQNSIVEQFQVIFNESVTLEPGAFTITNNADGVTVNSGPNPNTLAVNAGFAVVADTNNTQYLVTFSGPGTTAIPGGTGNVIKDGLYILNTIGSHVHANGLTAVADTNTGFWALYGSAPNGNALTSEPGAYLGDGNSEVFVSNFDYSEFKTAFGSESDFPIGPPAPYDVSMDFDLNGFVDNFDYAAFKNNFGADWVF